MDILAILIILLSVCTISGHSVLRKWLFNQDAVSEVEILAIQSGIAFLIAGIWFLTFTSWESLAEVKTNNTIFWIAVAGTTLANIVIQYTSTKAVKLTDLSFIAPIAAMAPGFVVLTAALFGEYPSTIGYIGIVLIVGGAYLHAREGSTLKEYLTPLFLWRIFGNLDHLDPYEQNKQRGLRYAYVGALFMTIGLTFDALLARHGNLALGATVQLGVLFLFFGTMLLYRVQKNTGTALVIRLKKYWKQITALSIFYGLPFILLGVAFRLAPIAYVGSLKRLAIPLTLIFAWWFLSERTNSRRRFITGGLIATGAVLLAFDPTQAVLIDNSDEYLRRIFGY